MEKTAGQDIKEEKENLIPKDEVVTPSVIEKTLYSWKAPARMFKRRSKEFWTKIGVIATLFGVILYLSEGVMPVILLVSAFFLFYILSTIEPENIEYKITNSGVYIAKDKTLFREIIRYWFSKNDNKPVLNLDTIIIPGRISLPINETDESKMRPILQKYIPEETPELSQSDKITDWLSQKLQ